MKNVPGAQFVVATPNRTSADAHARVLESIQRLRFVALGTRRGTNGIPPEKTRLNPAIGLAGYMAARTLPQFRAESFRFRLLPWFDHWAKKQLVPGDHIISSFGFANGCFKFVRTHGGKTFIDAGNSHPANFWEIMEEEHKRWHCPYPPVARHWNQRARAMMADVDYVISPSHYVTNSFLERGFKAGQILQCFYPVDLSLFKPPAGPRPQNRPLTVINTGSLSLRKGTPYLLEAFRKIHQTHPSARLLLMDIVQDDVKAVLKQYGDLPIEWAPALPHAQLVQRLHDADIFVLPSLEEGLVRTALEAMASGLPAVLTPNTGSSDYIQPGINGEVVPIRDSQAIADAVLKWAEKILAPGWQSRSMVNAESLSFGHFSQTFIDQLKLKTTVLEKS